ncbi:hypothetical protein LC574_31180 [Nostoc sp. CHAB 5715]|nr:hypothetical protein [Nostoc sp. CHAB 5715]
MASIQQINPHNRQLPRRAKSDLRERFYQIELENHIWFRSKYLSPSYPDTICSRGIQLAVRSYY